MYTVLRDRPDSNPPPPSEIGDGATPPPDGAPGTGNVVALGCTSMLTDVSSEMVNAVLPLYLMSQMGFSPVAFGVFDGAYQGTAGLLRLSGGLVADRFRRHKEVAGAGYALSAACKLGLLATPGGAATSAILLADRTGKGVRSAPRDALISLSAPPGRLGAAFGLHRALDTLGALLGPVLAFVMLGASGRDYHPLFVASFCAALLGLGVLTLFVRNVPGRASLSDGTGSATHGSSPHTNTVTWRSALALLRLPAFRRLTAGGALLAAVTVSDAFAYLVLSRRLELAARPFPLLFVGTALAYLVLAVPVGRLADRVGRAKVFVGGHAILLGALAVLRFGPAAGMTAVAFLALLGAYYAATDGVLMAAAATALPEDRRASGLAILTTATTTARFGASATFGLLWAWRGPVGAMSVFLAALAVALPVAAWLLRGEAGTAHRKEVEA